MEKVQTDFKKADFRDLWENMTGFTIKAKDDKSNRAIHESFKEFCKVECDNNYTWGLDVLLRYRQEDFKFEMIYKEIQNQAVALNDLKASVTKLTEQKQKAQEDENTGAF